MSLQADLAALHRGPRTFAQWLEFAAAEDRELVMEAVMDRTVPREALETTLRANGIPITVGTIEKYRDAQ